MVSSKNAFMLFLAEFLNVDVVDSADEVVGRLIDFIATTNGEGQPYPPITAFVVKDKKTKTQKIIPFSYVVNLSRDEVTLGTLLRNIHEREPASGDIFLYRDVVDKQIVDLEGTRVVRVNDIQFGAISGKPHVLGIDISTAGIFRRIGVDKIKPFSFLKPKFIDWQKIQVVGGSLKLSTLSGDLVKLHPADLANIVEDLNPTQSGNLMKSLDSETAAKVFEELEPSFRRYFMSFLDPARAKIILERLPVDEAVDFLKSLPKKESRRFLMVLDDGKQKAIQQFIQYEDDTAGGLLTSEVAKGNPDWTVLETREYIRGISDSFRSINFIYVLNDVQELLGVVSVRSLLVAAPEEKLRKIMKKVKQSQTVRVDADLDMIAEMMTKYNLSSLAVLDDGKKFLGVVTIDDVMRQFVPHA